MYTTVHAVMKLLLLLLTFVRTGVNGIDLLSIKQQGYEITYPCSKNFVCYHIWQINVIRNIYLAVVSNGLMEKFNTQEDRCILLIEDFPFEDIGRHFCHEDPSSPSSLISYSAAQVLNVLPGNTVSLQCVGSWPRCSTQTLRRVTLTWVDEVGSEIQNDSQHQILRRSRCDVILTITYEKPGNRTYRCWANSGTQTLTSVDFPVRAPAHNARRGGITEIGSNEEGGSQDVVGTAVGVVVCLVLTALIAAFVVNRRRTNSRLPDEPGSDQSTSNRVIDTDDVIYADVSFPAGSERVWIQDSDSTEYVCIQHKQPAV